MIRLSRLGKTLRPELLAVHYDIQNGDTIQAVTTRRGGMDHFPSPGEDPTDAHSQEGPSSPFAGIRVGESGVPGPSGRGQASADGVDDDFDFCAAVDQQ